MASRGILQRDPLSPFLCLLVSEVLSVLVENIHLKGLFEGFLVEEAKVHVSICNLLMIFCKYDVLEVLMKTVKVFKRLLGFKVNWLKSFLCGINVDDSKLLDYAAKFEC